MRDRVSPTLHAFVVRRDGCILYHFDKTHICRNAFGRSHGPFDYPKLTVDHVHEGYGMMGKRAPSTERTMTGMCWAGNVRGPSKAVRAAQRTYLASLYPTAVAS